MKYLILALLLMVTPVQAEQYRYKCKTVSVYDADTATFLCTLGFSVSISVRIRFYGINAPEVRGKSRKKGLEARDFLRDLILDKEVVIVTIKDKKGKYGRYLGVIWVELPDQKVINVNHTLVERGYAIYKDY